MIDWVRSTLRGAVAAKKARRQLRVNIAAVTLTVAVLLSLSVIFVAVSVLLIFKKKPVQL